MVHTDSATLYYLARFSKVHPTNEISGEQAEAHIYSQIANRLAELIEDVVSVSIDRFGAPRAFNINAYSKRWYITSSPRAI